MRRVVVTGMGIVSSIGNNVAEVLESLRRRTSGIVFAPRICRARLPLPGARRAQARSVRECSTAAPPASWARARPGTTSPCSRRSPTRGSRKGHQEPAHRPRHGLGRPLDPHGGRGRRHHPRKRPQAHRPARRAQGDELDRLGDARHPFGIKGVNYSITSACATSKHCIGNGYEQIQMGKQDIVFAGGHEDLDWTMSNLFDAMGAMSTDFNATPAKASRAYDVDRDGFVIAGGAGVLVLEELEHAKARGAKILAEIVGYGATSDGYDMVAPSGEGAARCMQLALETVKEKIDYINPHATSTPVGDVKEMEAIRHVFGTGDACPPISATKSLTGHSLGATGVQESIYCILMMQQPLPLRERQHRQSRSGLRRHADPPRPPRQRRRRDRAVQQLRLRRHQRDASCSSGSTRKFFPSHVRSDERQARNHHGGRQRPLDRVGNRQGAGGGGRGARLHLSGRGARQARRPRSPKASARSWSSPAMSRTPPRSTRCSIGSRPTGARSTSLSTASASPTAAN